MRTVLQTKGLKKHYKSNFQVRTIKALDGIDLDVNEGEVYGFIGHNGAGKTTTIKILTGLIRATGGTAEIMGQPVGHKKTLEQVGFLPERPYFYEYLSAREALVFYGRLNGMSRAEISRRSEELLHLLDLEHAADRPLNSYSKGMLQRLGMAQAVLHDPHLVILDEPMSGLDPVGRGQIKDIIQLLRKRGKTIFFSTHILADVEQLCDRVALVANGKMWYSGTVDGLTSQYQQGYEFTLLGLTEEQQRFCESLGGHIQEKLDKLVMSLPELNEPGDVALKLLQQGISIESMAPQRMSLEEIFVNEFKKEEEASGEGLRDRA